MDMDNEELEMTKNVLNSLYGKEVKQPRRSVFEGIFRVYENKERGILHFESKDSKKIKSICNGSVHLSRYDKTWKYCVLIYSKEENKFYFYHNMKNDSGCYIGQKVKMGEALNIGDEVELKIFEECICSPINNYYDYLKIKLINDKEMKGDGIYYG